MSRDTFEPASVGRCIIRREATQLPLFLDHLDEGQFEVIGEAMGRVFDAIAEGEAKRA